jgi:hypothetical protein
LVSVAEWIQPAFLVEDQNIAESMVVQLVLALTEEREMD